jgi:hypothetical protein
LDASGYPGTRDEYRRGYAAQVQYVLRAVRDALARQLAATSRPAVVIVHGDHGPAMDVNLLDVERSDLSERFRIFMAVRWAPGGRENAPTPETPVNLYRYVFTRYFGADLPPLPDRSLVSGWNTPYLVRELDRNRLKRRSPGRAAGRAAAGTP